MTVADPQRDLVYRMERAAFDGCYQHKLPLATLRQLARKTCRAYRVPLVKVHVRRNPGADAEYVYDHDRKHYTIQLCPEQGRNAFVLAHELAHHIVTLLHPRVTQDHGPTWCAVYAVLLDEFRLLPLPAFLRVAAGCGVNVRPIKPSSR